MLTDVLTIRNTDAQDIEYALINVDGNNTIRRSRSSSLSEPHTLVVKHSATPKDTTMTDRTLISFQDTVLVGGKSRQVTLNLTFTIDRDISGGNGVGQDMLARLASLLIDDVDVDTVVVGNMSTLAKLLLGEA